MIKGKAVIAQGGGPTAVINQSLVGAVTEALRSDNITSVYGAIHGVRGIINEDFIDLSMASRETLEKIACSPASALKSTRDKPDCDYCDEIFKVLQAHDVRYFYYIGGNDSADTCRIISETAQTVGYELKVVHIPKTIDNDLRVTDHCPGFGSAAKFVSNAFAGINLDNRALPGVYLGVVMGRDAGFLTASSAMAHRYEDDAPHLIYIPESTFNTDRFLSHIDDCYSKYGRCIVALSEGVRNSEGVPIVATLQEQIERDAHGNVQLSGTGALADSLVSLIRNNLSVSKVRGDTFGYLQRSFAGCVSPVDAQEARTIGEMAVKYSLREDFTGGSIAMKRIGDYVISYEPTPLASVARLTKSMDPSFYNEETAQVTAAFMNYVRPIVGEFPECHQFDVPSVSKIYRK